MEAESNWVLEKRWMPSDPPEQHNGEASVAEFENKLVEICLDSGFLLRCVGTTIDQWRRPPQPPCCQSKLADHLSAYIPYNIFQIFLMTIVNVYETYLWTQLKSTEAQCFGGWHRAKRCCSPLAVNSLVGSERSESQFTIGAKTWEHFSAIALFPSVYQGKVTDNKPSPHIHLEKENISPPPILASTRV